MKKWKLMFATMMIAAVFVLSACGGSYNFVGRWENPEIPDWGLEFFSDGTVLMHDGPRPPLTGQWFAEGGRVIIEGNVFYYEFEDNNVLILVNMDEFIVLLRVR